MQYFTQLRLNSIAYFFYFDVRYLGLVQAYWLLGRLLLEPFVLLNLLQGQALSEIGLEKAGNEVSSILTHFVVLCAWLVKFGNLYVFTHRSDTVITFKRIFPSQQRVENAAQTPNVHCLRVILMLKVLEFGWAILRRPHFRRSKFETWSTLITLLRWLDDQFSGSLNVVARVYAK